MMQNKALEYVMAIWKNGTFSKAARELYISQPSLSQFINNLEHQIGMPLFKRGTNPLELTNAGRVFVKYAAQILELHKKMDKELREIDSTVQSNLVLGAASYFSLYLLAPIISRFEQNHQSITVSMNDTPKTQRLQALLNGHLDLLFSPRYYGNMQIESKKLLEERILLALPPTHRLVSEETMRYQQEVALPAMYARDYNTLPESFENDFPAIPLLDLRDEAFVMTRASGSLRKAATDLCRELGFEPKIASDNVNIESALSYSIQGIGITFIPETILRFYHPYRAPAYFRIREKSFSRNLYAAYLKNSASDLAMEFANLSAQILTSPISTIY